MNPQEHIPTKQQASAWAWRLLPQIAGAVVALGTAAVLVWNVGEWILRPRLQPHIDRLAKVDLLLERAAEIRTDLAQISSKMAAFEATTTEAPPVLVFFGAADSWPASVLPGEELLVTYQAQRLSDCFVEVVARFYSVRDNGIVPRFSTDRAPLGAPVTRNPIIITITLMVPHGLSPGRWGYAPMMIPDNGCENTEAVIPPPAFFTVLDTGEP